jgi:hypothetical protein
MIVDVNFTDHARARRQQRCIPKSVIQLLLKYGSERHQTGARLLHFDKLARKRLCADFGPDADRIFGKYLDAYLVEGQDGVVITAGYRSKRLWNH